jgi:crossover junction endodeoxyribonuclease RuvC
VRVFGIDPGCERTGYGCVETDGSRHRIVVCGAISSPALASFADKLHRIHSRLVRLLEECQPESVAIENLFFSVNVRSALKLGHARGVAMLAAVEAGVPVFEYTPAEIKRAVVGYGRADKPQVQQMIKLLLGLDAVPSPHDAADALAIAICHVHAQPRAGMVDPRDLQPARSHATSWRTYRPASAPDALQGGTPDALRRGKPASTPGTLRRGKPARS